MVESEFKFSLCKRRLQLFKEICTLSFENGDLSELLAIRKTKRTNIVRALSNLAKFLGVHEEFLKLMHSHAMEWGGKSSDDIIIERLTKVKDPDEVFNWIRRVKKARMELTDFMDLMAITGMRLVEAIKSYNLIVNLAGKGKLNEYYNEEMGTLEHYKFKEQFIRRSKKAFISFVPKQLVESIASNDPLPDSRSAIQMRVKKQGLKLRFSDIREAHASFQSKVRSRLERKSVQSNSGNSEQNFLIEYIM